MNLLIFRCIYLIIGLMFTNTMFASKHNLRILVRLDDCHLSGDAKTERIIKLFARYKTPLNAGIIPFGSHKNNQPDTFNPIYQNVYTEIFVHGYKHEKYKSDEFSGIPYLIQSEKIKAGTEILKACNVYPCCFAPPWNGYDENTLTALTKHNFLIVSANEFGCKNNPKIKYVPSTCYSVRDAINIIRKGSVFNGIIVLLIHPYEFNSENDFQLLEKLLITVQLNKVEAIYFSNLNSLDENITSKRLQYHRNPLFYFLRSNNLLGLNKNIYYEIASLMFINVLEWFMLIFLLIYLHLKIVFTFSHYQSIVVGIVLFSLLIISYTNGQDSYRWIFLHKTLVIAFLIWLNNRLLLQKKLKPTQAT